MNWTGKKWISPFLIYVLERLKCQLSKFTKLRESLRSKYDISVEFSFYDALVLANFESKLFELKESQQNSDKQN